MNGFLLTRDLLSIPILSILLLSLQWVLKKSKTDFLRYIGYRNFINDLIKHVSLLILVLVRLLFFSKLLTLCLTAVKIHSIRYYDTVYERDGINYFWSIKNSNDVLNKFKSKNFQASKLSTYDFSTLYTTLPHHLIKDKLMDLIDRTFIRENTQYLACNEESAFFTSDVYNNHNSWSCQKVCDALVYLLDNIFIRFGTKLYRQTIGIPMGTNCAPLVADLFLVCYERDFMKSLSRENQADIIEAFNSTSRYLDDLLNIDNIYFDQMVDRIYPTELQLNRTNSSDTETPFLDLNLCIYNGTVSTKIYDKWDDFDFDIVNFPFLDGDVPRRASYGVYISQLIRFARASSNLNDFNYRNKALTAKGRTIVILNFVRRFRNFIADTVPC